MCKELSTSPGVAAVRQRRLSRQWVTIAGARQSARLSRSIAPAWLMLFLLLFCSLIQAQPDDTQQAWLNRVLLPAQWDNVEGAPEWITGARPGFRISRLLHTFALRPGESVTVRVAAGERVRLYYPDGEIDPQEFEFSWSNGSGLFAALQPESISDKQSLVATPPQGAGSLVRVQRKENFDRPMELALFISRDPNRLTATSYREKLLPVTSRAGVRLNDGTHSYDFWRADREAPIQFELDGATRIKIESRLVLPNPGGPYADSYRISVHLNGEPWQVLDLATTLDTTGAIAFDGCNQPVGRPAYAYLDIPEGPQRLELRVRRPMLVRLLARQQPADYLHRGNRPLDYDATVGGNGSLDSTPYFWGRTDDQLSTIRKRFSQPDSVTYLDAVRVAQNNAHRLGGLLAMKPLSEWARRYPGQSHYQALAARRKLVHTFYRDLMPSWGIEEADPVFAWFMTPRLEQHSNPVFITETYAHNLTGNLASGFFSKLPATPQHAREFLIPRQAQPPLIRIGVDRTGLTASETLFVQLDDAEPIRLQVEKTRALPASDFRPNTGSVALSLLQQQYGTGAATLSGAFGARHAAAPLADVSFIELPIAAQVRRLKVWRAAGGLQPLRVALAYRTSGWYRMSQTGYLGLLDTLGPTGVQRLFQETLSKYDPEKAQPTLASHLTGMAATSSQQDMLADLHNQWLPLMRFLHARYGQFSSGVENNSLREGRHSPASQSEIGTAIQRAELAEQSNNWQSALETWSWIWRVTEGTRQLQARSRQINALTKLGNFFLAKQLLRHDLLYGGQPSIQKLALRTLIEIAERDGNREGVVTLRAVWAIMDPQPAALNELASSLLATGRARYALLVLLSLPEDQRPTRAVLELAYAEGWWSLFEETLSASSDVELNSLWRGYRAQLQGDYQTALELWQKAGQTGRALAIHLRDGLLIRDQLGSPTLEIRRQALLRWEQWQWMAAGAETWSDIPQSITGHGGVKTILATNLEEFSDLFRSTPATPVKVSAYGPMSLRFEVHPLHSIPNGEPINDWITIRSPGGEERFPVIDNRESAGLRLASESRPRPGQRVEILYQVPAGYHELQLNGKQHDMLLKVSALRPRFPLTVLPPLNPYTAREALTGGATAPPSAISEKDQVVLVQMVKQCTGEDTLAVHPFPVTGDYRDGEPVPGIEPPTTAWFQQLADYRAQRAEEEGRLESQRHQPSGATTDDYLKTRLIELLWEAEQRPGQYGTALTKAEHLVQELPPEAGTESILRRLRRKASWELVRSAQQSAGVRLVEFTGWHPETPVMRTRKAVMQQDVADEQIISGHDTRVLSMYNLKPVELTLKFSMQDLAHLPSDRMRVLLAWDDMPETELLLNAERPVATQVKRVAAGNHLVRIRIARPLANQLLRVKINERRGNTDWVVSEPIQRSYTLATREQPLVLLLQGPTRLRIDEWRTDRTLTSYRSLKPGWQKVVIAVEPGRDEALLRVFRRTLEPDKPIAPVRATQQITQPVAEPIWNTIQFDRPPDSLPSEPLPLGGQEDGTWSLLGGLVSRRSVDDEPQSSPEEKRFISLGTAYRYFSAAHETYYQADGVMRLREHGDPTLAIRGSIGIRKPDWPLDLDIAGSLFLQNLDTTGQTESAVTLRARISRYMRIREKTSHRPSLSLFQRWLSLDQLPDNEREKVDQDIFTRYKRDHKRGLRIGDRIQYRPWLDTSLYAGAYLVSNEDLNILDPDHLGLNIGARQLIGDVNLGINYNRRQYFKDSDRDESSDAQRLWVNLGFSRWFNPRHGLRASLRYEYDHNSADSSVFLSFALDSSNGRYYRDFKPNDLDFRALRQRRAVERQAVSGLE